MNLLQTISSLLYPHNCALCARPLPEGDRGWLCEEHLQAVKRIQPPCCQRCGAPFAGEISNAFECANCAGMKLHFETTVCAVRADGIARECIHRFKYGRQLWLDQHLGDWLADSAAARVAWRDVDALVPVPLFPRREREREFNQAELLAEHLAKRFDKPVWSRNLRRIRDTRTQTRLDREQREQNVRGAFTVKASAQFKGRSLALVDDVFTTGATTSECARVLKEAGAALVIVLAVAHG